MSHDYPQVTSSLVEKKTSNVIHHAVFITTFCPTLQTGQASLQVVISLVFYGLMDIDLILMENEIILQNFQCIW